MSLTKQQLQQLNNTNFPNNTTGYITPALLRDFNSQSVDSMALQTQVDSLSSSFQSQLNDLEDFSSSLVTNFATVAQLNTSSSVLQSNINGKASTGSVNTLSQSVYVGFSDQATINTNVSNRFTADEAKFNAYTQSNNTAVAGKASLSQDNYFVGNQYVTGQVSVNGIISASGDIRAAGNVYGANLTGSFVSSSTFNSFTASYLTFSGSQYKADSASFSSRIEAVTGSGGTVNTGSLLVTASFNNGTRNLTFTKGDASTFNVNIPDVSGSTFDTGSLVTTASFNAYTSSQDFKNTTFATTSSVNTLSSSIFQTDATQSNNIASNSSSVGLLQTFSGSQYKNDSSSFDSRINAITSSGGNVSVQEEGSILGNATSFNFIGAGVTATFSAGTASVTIPNGGSINTGSFATTGSNTFIGNQIVSGNVNISDTYNLTVGNGGFTSLQNASIKALTCTSSVTILAGGLISTGSIRTTDDVIVGLGITAVSNISTSANVSGLNIVALQDSASIFASTYATTASVNSLSASIFSTDATQSSLINGKLDTSSFNTFTASQIVSNSYFATTGSNTFIGSQWFSDPTDTNSYAALTEWSGSLILSAKGYFTGSFPQLTSSLANAAGTGFVNLLFKGDGVAANTILSGSNNILANPIAPTATFYRQVGNGNLALTGVLPQVSASMLFPITMNGNTILATAGGITMRGPVSASGWTISANSILGTVNIGTATNTHAERINSLTMTSNQIAGTLAIVANSSSLATAFSITNNNINGGFTINAISSSLAAANNNINDSNFTITNNFFSSSLGTGQLAFNRNNIGGQQNSLLVQGGVPTGGTGQPSISDNTMLGGANTLFVDVANAALTGSAPYFSAIRNIIGGNNLIVSGSSSLGHLQTVGSAFFGRYNAQDGNKSKSGQTVFAVGTGNTTNRKTGFLIDSGSNTFVEGTLNVSGSTTFTGSVSVASTFQLQLPSGSNQQTGLATLDGGNPGTVTVSNTLVTANSIIMLTKQTNNHPNAGPVVVSSKGSNTFTITSNHNADTDVVAFMIINPS